MGVVIRSTTIRSVRMKTRVCATIIMTFVTSYSFAQEPAATQAERPSQLRSPPAATSRSKPPASPPSINEVAACLYESKEYSVGANVCISGQLAQVCQPPNNDHPSTYWV